MSSAASEQAEAKRTSRPNYLTVDYGIRSWLLATDHKRIALLYLVSITLFFVLGGLFAVLAVPDSPLRSLLPVVWRSSVAVLQALAHCRHQYRALTFAAARAKLLPC